MRSIGIRARTRSSSAGTGCTPGARASPKRFGTSKSSNSSFKPWDRPWRSGRPWSASRLNRRRAVMAIVRILSENITMTETNALASYLASRGIDYERWTLDTDLPPDPTPEHVLAAYAGEVGRLHHRGGY